ncbi:MAG: hypothetical protein IPH84_18345, partial [Bacteroidales bacterium]|nr:hypothetical protein [Bacteroidales bacterium]
MDYLRYWYIQQCNYTQPCLHPSAADIAAGSVTLTITASSAAPCVSASDAMVLDISRQAVVNAGADATICEGSAYTVSGATASYYSSILWTSSGTGVLSDETTLTPTYTPAAGETGVITLTLTATSDAPCTDATDQMTITITPAATVSAGADATICETGSYTLAGSAVANATTLLWSTSGTGTFNNMTALHPIYTPSAADITAGAVTLTITAMPAAPCTAVSNAMVLNINRQATVNAGADATICESGTYTLVNAVAANATTLQWATSGTGTFDDATALNPVYTPSVADITAGSVTLTITASSAAPCSDATDAMVLNINGQATVNAGADATICETAGSYTLSGAAVTNATTLLWTTSGTGTFNNATTLNPVYTPSAADIAAGTVTLTITASSAAPCVSASDAMVLNISRQAVVNAGADATICEGST